MNRIAKVNCSNPVYEHAPEDGQVPILFAMKAVIFSDDSTFAANAASILARVGRQAGVNVQWTTKSWPMNALNETASAEKALLEASDAHLILFPEHRASSLPVRIFDWLERWTGKRTIPDAAVGVIRDGSSTNLATKSCPELFRFTREHGLSFIVDEDRPVKIPARPSIQFAAEQIAALHVPQTNPSRLTPGCYRSFGINE